MAGHETLAAGSIPAISAKPGDVKTLGSTTIVIPPLAKPVRAQLVAELAGTDVTNSWDLWLFPKRRPDTACGKGVSAPPRIHGHLVQRYPGMARTDAPQAAAAKIVVTDRIDDAACRALDEGKNVLLVRLPGRLPGAALGWWWTNDQRGTAIARHAAFGMMPHDGWLNPLLFRMMRNANAVRLEQGPFRGVEPLMVGHGGQGYLAYVFQVRTGAGKLLGCGLDLLANQPESAYLLDQFLAYMQSDQFQPSETIVLASVKAEWTLRTELNGWAGTTVATDRRQYASFRGEYPMCIARLTGGAAHIAWTTQPVSEDVTLSPSYTFRWMVGMGWISEPAGKFTLMLDEVPLVDFDVSQKDATWRNSAGDVTLKYTVKSVSGEDSSGVMELTLPASWLTPGQPVELHVVPVQNGSRRWFGLYEYP